jgi:hypothetical protein
LIDTTESTADPLLKRAIAHARRWYPAGAADLFVAGRKDNEVCLLVVVEGSIGVVRYRDLDAPG